MRNEWTSFSDIIMLVSVSTKNRMLSLYSFNISSISFSLLSSPLLTFQQTVLIFWLRLSTNLGFGAFAAENYVLHHMLPPHVKTEFTFFI